MNDRKPCKICREGLLTLLEGSTRIIYLGDTRNVARYSQLCESCGVETLDDDLIKLNENISKEARRSIRINSDLKS